MPTDVIQNVIIRIGAQAPIENVLTRALTAIRGSVSDVQASLAAVATSAAASALKSATAFSQGRGDLAAAAKGVVEKARGELEKLTANKDIRLGIEIASEKLDEARIKIGQFVAHNTRGVQLKWAVALDFADEMVDEARRFISAKLAPVARAVRLPLSIAKEKLAAGLVEADGIIDRWRREHGSVRIVFAVAASTSALMASASTLLGPLKQMAASGINVVFRGSVAGLATAARTAMTSISSIASGALSAATAVGAAVGIIGAVVLAGVAAAGAALIGFKHSVMESIDATGDLADRLGATTEGLMALEHAARTNGSSADVMDNALQKMSRTIGDAVRGSAEAASQFDKLGLAAGDLSKMNADDAFTKIATQIAALPTPAERASAAIGVFGRESGSLQTLLAKGATGIAAARAEAERMGLTLSRIDVAKVHAANDALESVANQLKGYLAQAAVAIAPYIQGIADQLLSLMPTGQQAGEFLVNAMESVAEAVAYVADYLNLFQAGWYSLKAGVIAVVGGVIKAVDLLGQGIVDLVNLMPGVNETWTNTFSAMADSMAQDAVDATDKASEAYDKFARGDASAAVGKFFDEARAKAQKNAEEIAKNADALRATGRAAGQAGDDMAAAAENAKKLVDEIAQITLDRDSIGLTDVDKEVEKLRALHATPIQIDLAIDTGNIRKQIEDVLKGVTDNSIDPWTGWEEGLDVLDRLRAAGKLTTAQFDSLRQQINKAFETKTDDLAKSIRDSLKTPIDQALEQLQQIQTLVDLGKLTKDEGDRAAAALYQKAVAANGAPVFASGQDTGISTGAADAARERLALLTPLREIHGTLQDFFGWFRQQQAREANSRGAEVPVYDLSR